MEVEKDVDKEAMCKESGVGVYSEPLACMRSSNHAY